MQQRTTYGRYKVRGVLGRGAMGTVYRAEDPLIKRKVAIKTIRTDHDPGGNANLQMRFEREFRSAGALSHPNIVTVYDVGREGEEWWLAMELVVGEALEDLLSREPMLPADRVAELTAEIASGLDYSHRNSVVHRDIKPANIMMTAEGVPKITDFGVARFTDATTTQHVVGTPSYMSPEQITGEAPEAPSDQFSLGVMAFQMLTGTRPFQGDNATTLMYKIVQAEPELPADFGSQFPAAVKDVLLRVLAKNPDERFASCSDFAAALTAALRGEEVAALPRRPGADPDATVALGSRQAVVAAAKVAAPAPNINTTGTAAMTADVTPLPAAPSQPQMKKRSPLLIGLAVAAILVAAGTWALRDSLGLFGSGPSLDSGTGVDAPAGEQLPPENAETPPTTSGSAVQGETADPTVSNDPVAAPVEAAPVEAAPTSPPPETVANEESGEANEGAVPAPAEVVALERLQVTSSPSGARVVFDGQALSQSTPAEIEIEPGREYRLRIEADGYEPASWSFAYEDLNDTQLQRRTLHFPMTPDTPPGRLVLQAPYAVQIRVRLADGGDSAWRDVATSTSHDAELAPGMYDVEVSAPDVFYRTQQRVEIRSEASSQLQVPATVQVQVAANPSNCRVTVNGRFVDVTPFQLDIVPGEHEFVFEWPAQNETVTRLERIQLDTRRIFAVPQ